MSERITKCPECGARVVQTGPERSVVAETVTYTCTARCGWEKTVETPLRPGQ